MNDLQHKTVAVAVDIMDKHRALLEGVEPRVLDNIRVLLQYAFLAGRMDGLEAASAAYKRVAAEVLGAK